MTLLATLLMMVSAFAGCLEGIEVSPVDPTDPGGDDTGNQTNGTDPLPDPDVDNGTDNGTGTGNGTGPDNGTGTDNGTVTDNGTLDFVFILTDSDGVAQATPYHLDFPAPPMADGSPYPMSQICSASDGFFDAWMGSVPAPFNTITSWKVYNVNDIMLGMFVSHDLPNASSLSDPIVLFTQNFSASGHITAELADLAGGYICVALPDDGSDDGPTGELILTMSMTSFTAGLAAPDMVHIDAESSMLTIDTEYRLEYALSMFGQPVPAGDWESIEWNATAAVSTESIWWDVAGVAGVPGLSPGSYCLVANLMVQDENGTYQTLTSDEACFDVITTGLHLEVEMHDVVDELSSSFDVELWDENTSMELRAYGMNDSRDYGLLVSMRHLDETPQSLTSWDMTVILIDDPLSGGMVFDVDMANLTDSGANATGCHYIDAIRLYDRSGESPTDADALGSQIWVAYGVAIETCGWGGFATDLVAGTDWTNYTAYMNDFTMVNAQLTSYWTELGSEYRLEWFLNNSTTGDQIPDTNIDSGEFTWTGGEQGWSSENLTFPVRGPNMAMGLVEGWHCVHADLYENESGVLQHRDSDDACFMVELPGDGDGDGYAADIDCDDNNISINPGATDVWNGVDDDCDDVVDEFIDYSGNATFDYISDSIAWVIKNKTADYEGHDIYWLPDDNYAYRFVATPDYVFTNGSGDRIENLTNTPNIDATLQSLGLTSANLSVTLTEMSLGTDTENVEWSYDSITHIETRGYDGGEYIFRLDGVEFLRLDTGLTEYLNYSEYFGANWATANVTMNGSTDRATINITANQVVQPELWRLAQSFMVDMNGTMQVDFASQDAILQTSYNMNVVEANSAGVNTVITGLLSCAGGGSSCPNWIAGVFHFEATARAQP